MTIRFNCAACRAVMKLGAMIDEPKKVRCKSCGMVILLTPNSADPLGMTVTVPKKSDRPQSMTRPQQRMLLMGGLAAMAIFLAVGLWWTFSNPSDRGSVDGMVNNDDGPLPKGNITFTSSKDGKETIATTPIVRGRYGLSASRGPALGLNKVQITGDDDNPVHARYNTDSDLSIEINLGPNNKDWEVKSK